MFFFEKTETYKNIVYPSYLSVVSVCYPHGTEYAESKGYIQGGQFNLSDNKITIFLEDLDNSIGRHENCHFQQAMGNRSYGCNRKLFMFMNEIECYIAEK